MRSANSSATCSSSCSSPGGGTVWRCRSTAARCVSRGKAIKPAPTTGGLSKSSMSWLPRSSFSRGTAAADRSVYFGTTDTGGEEGEVTDPFFLVALPTCRVGARGLLAIFVLTGGLAERGARRESGDPEGGPGLFLAAVFVNFAHSFDSSAKERAAALPICVRWRYSMAAARRTGQRVAVQVLRPVLQPARSMR